MIIAALGITDEPEGEEMPVDVPGFLGGDRTSLDLPAPEEDLLKAVASAGKPLIVVLMNGSALSVNWANEHANAILEDWYSGEEGGNAIAETLSGKNNPGGRLPVAFYQNVNHLPALRRLLNGEPHLPLLPRKPLYSLGHGLSYLR